MPEGAILEPVLATTVLTVPPGQYAAIVRAQPKFGHVASVVVISVNFVTSVTRMTEAQSASHRAIRLAEIQQRQKDNNELKSLEIRQFAICVKCVVIKEEAK